MKKFTEFFNEGKREILKVEAPTIEKQLEKRGLAYQEVRAFPKYVEIVVDKDKAPSVVAFLQDVFDKRVTISKKDKQYTLNIPK